MEYSEISSPEISGETSCLDGEILKIQILEALAKQGFEIRANQLCLPEDLDKEKIRYLHSEATRHKIEKRKKGLHRYESSLLQRFASGQDVIPEKVEPK